VSWILPAKGACVSGRTTLQVTATSGSALVSSVGLFEGMRQIARLRKNTAGVYTFTWRARGRKGAHALTAIASDTAGREARVSQPIRVCG
jgi:hypothetical protein